MGAARKHGFESQNPSLEKNATLDPSGQQQLGQKWKHLKAEAGMQPVQGLNGTRGQPISAAEAFDSVKYGARMPTSENIMQLQTTIGNRAVGELLADRTGMLHQSEPIKKHNNTGLPDRLKTGIENLSGMTMDDVKVHYNSTKPAQLDALAYAQGTDIHLAPGQEKCLAHEAWHVVQQKQGRVIPTRQVKNVAINDDPELEKEADAIASKAQTRQRNVTANARLEQTPEPYPQQSQQCLHKGAAPIQRTKKTEKKIIEQYGDAEDLTDEQSQQLINKMRKGQSFRNARKIAAEIEAETAVLVQSLSPQEGEQVKKAIKNYVASSTAIQNSARNQETLAENVRQLDWTLDIIRQQIAENKKRRITYRSITYDRLDEIPYDRDESENSIKVGDTVSDLGFVSTSEHRQFILGKTQTGKTTALLKLAILGFSGVPIALHIQENGFISYSNANELKLWEMKKNRLEKIWLQTFGQGPHAGQGEVLYGRNSYFTVKQIERKETEVEVVLVESKQPNQKQTVVKDMKSGTPLAYPEEKGKNS